MKKSTQIKFFLAATLAAAAFIGAEFYLSDPVTVEYGEWRATPPISLVLAALLLVLAMLWLILKALGLIFFLPHNFASWRGRSAGKKRERIVADGLRALSLRDSKMGLRSFASLAQNAAAPAAPAGALLAAKAAHERGETELRDNWLRAAANGDDAQVAALAQALLARTTGNLQEALEVLRKADSLKGPPALRRLMLEIAAEKGDWNLALTAAYKEEDEFPRRSSRHSPRDIIRRQLTDNAADAAMLRAFWKDQLRAPERADGELLAAHILALKARGDSAEDELDAAVKARGDAAAVLGAVVLAGDARRCEAALKRAEGLPPAKRETGKMLRAMAELAARLKLWGKARQYYQMAQALLPDPRNLRAMAEMAEMLERERQAGENANRSPESDPERQTA